MTTRKYLTPANWVRQRVQWEDAAPTFHVPAGEDPTLLPAIAAQHALARQVTSHLNDNHSLTANQLTGMPFSAVGITPAVGPLPYSGFSASVSHALAGSRLLTFDVYCELMAVFRPEVVPQSTSLVDAMTAGIGSVGMWPEPTSWEPRQSRPTTDAASEATQQMTHTSASSEPEKRHPDANVAISGLLMELAPSIDAWAGEGVSDDLEVDVDVYVGDGRANMVVAGGLLSGQMWIPNDWGVRVAEEARSSASTFVLDDLGVEAFGNEVARYRVAAPLSRLDARRPANPVYLAIGDDVIRRFEDANGVWYVIDNEV